MRGSGGGERSDLPNVRRAQRIAKSCLFLTPLSRRFAPRIRFVHRRLEKTIGEEISAHETIVGLGRKNESETRMTGMRHFEMRSGSGSGSVKKMRFSNDSPVAPAEEGGKERDVEIGSFQVATD